MGTRVCASRTQSYRTEVNKCLKFIQALPFSDGDREAQAHCGSEETSESHCKKARAPLGLRYSPYFQVQSQL